MAKPKPKKPARSKPAAARPSAKRRPVRATARAASRPRPTLTKSSPKSPASVALPALSPLVLPKNPDERVHVLSLSFVRDGDEFLARIETDRDQIIELKNRSLDQLLTLVASELEDLLE
jgi:hypothetical protein